MSVKSDLTNPYVLLPTFPLDLISQRFDKGRKHYDISTNATKFSRNASNNWEDGVNNYDFMHERLSHMIRHGFLARDAMKKPDKAALLDELAGVAANAIMLMSLVNDSDWTQDR